MTTVIPSKIDKSVNFVDDGPLEGFIESRYVRKVDDYFICYLSSQTNCDRGCKFCWLTATKQTKVIDVTAEGFLEQAKVVFEEYLASGIRAKWVNFNAMARGEILANKKFINNADSILNSLGELALSYDSKLNVKFNVSTIVPKDLNKRLIDIFKYIYPTIYLSLYSANHKFRKEWMPNALDLDKSLDMLKEYQEISKKRIKIHHAFIKDANDDYRTIEEWSNKLNNLELDWDFNLVRYNPYSDTQGKEPSDESINLILSHIKSLCPGTVKMIVRVGPDVLASCGQFVDKEGSVDYINNVRV